MEKIHIDEFEVQDMIIEMFGLDPETEFDDVEKSLYDELNVTFDQFHNILEILTPMIDVGTSPLTNKTYKGFSISVDKKKPEQKKFLIKTLINQ